VLKCVFTPESFVSIFQDPEVADMMGDMVADMVEPVYCRGGAGVLGTPAPPGLAATRRLALARTTGPMRVEPPLGGSLRGALVYRYPQLLRLHMEVAHGGGRSLGDAWRAGRTRRAPRRARRAPRRARRAHSAMAPVLYCKIGILKTHLPPQKSPESKS